MEAIRDAISERLFMSVATIRRFFSRSLFIFVDYCNTLNVGLNDKALATRYTLSKLDTCLLPDSEWI